MIEIGDAVDRLAATDEEAARMLCQLATQLDQAVHLLRQVRKDVPMVHQRKLAPQINIFLRNYEEAT